MTINIMIVDDDPLVRRGLTALVATEDSLHTVAEADNGQEALRAAQEHHIDLVLMDIRMPVMNGIEASRHLAALPQRPRIIVLTTFDLDEYVYAALAAGADGFLLKDTDPDEIIRAIHVVAAGGGMLHPVAARQVIDRFHQGDRHKTEDARRRVAKLTPRETQVLQHVALGASNAQIGAELHMQETTVKAHVSRILATLGANNRVQAALIARDANLPTP
ncbi:response regulator transcription factor [Streptomyces sp. NPDC002262]|uniref:response regulator transcription factor n=1 Tax=Streptomyces sp. NPDC002262 TaxID=3154414 RepID=UPI0033231667